MTVNVGVGGLSLGAQHRLLAAVQHVHDQLGHLGTGQGPIGVVVGAVFLTSNDIQSGKGLHGLLMLDFIDIGEILVGGSRADNHQANEHDGSQSEAERPLEVSHLDFLLFVLLMGGNILFVSMKS